MELSTPCKWRHFQAEIILLCIRLGYRDLEEVMLERGLHIDHTTIYRSRATLRTQTREARPSPS